MGDHQSASQVRAERVAAMKSPLGELHYALSNEAIWLHYKWKTFIDLFATSDERIELLNATAPVLFHDLQGILWEDALLHINRLTQPPKSMGHENLTIAQLPLSIPDENGALKAQVTALVENAKAKAEFARAWRNRRIAHRELPPLDGTGPTPLPLANRAMVRDALAAICEVLNAVELHCQNSTTHYAGIGSLRGAGALAFYLEKGLEVVRREKKSCK